MKKPLKNQSLVERGTAAAKDLINRLVSAYARKGKDAAWAIIADAIRDEGQYVREASPAAVMTYQAYIFVAVSFLTEHHDLDKAIEFTKQVESDITGLQEQFLMLRSTYTKDEFVSLSAAMTVMREQLILLLDHYSIK